MTLELATVLLLFIVVLVSIYLSGVLARRRGRSFYRWALFAAVLVGPLAILILYALPDRRHAPTAG